MARIDTEGMDDLISEMTRMGELSGEVAKVMAAAAGAEIRGAWRESAEAHRLRKTGAMIESIGFPGPVQKIGDTVYQDVTAMGKDSKGTRNAEKAFVLNYGTSRIRPTHWVDEAEAAAGPRVQEKLEKIWGDFLETGKVPAVIDPGSTESGITKTIK